MHKLDTIRAYFADANIRQVSRETGLHYQVIYRLLNGDTNPRYETVLALSDYIDQKQEALNENR